MKTILKFVITALIITSLAITTISAIDSADSTQYNTLDQTKNFLSNVIGLDLTKYSLTPSPYQLRYNNTANTTRVPDETIYRPDEASGYKREGPIYRFVYDNSTIDVLSIFYNGQLVVVNIYPINNNASYTYASKPGII